MSVYTDESITCRDCGQSFPFTAGEQAFFAAKEFTPPVRCASCRSIRRSQRERGDLPRPATSAFEERRLPGAPAGYSRGGYSERPQREFFEAECSGCGATARVPFRPTSGKPVFCSDCFGARRN